MATIAHLRNYKTAQVHPATGRQIRSVTIQAEYDCHLERERILATTFHADAMATGSVVASEVGDSQWHPITPGSVSDTVWRAACR